MAIILVPQPGSTPTSLTDWTNAVESLKQYNLSVNQPLDYDFSGNTIKKGTQIIIGGSNYYANSDTAITGTPSNYVQITSAGVASYVASLAGVSWNDTYNFYADGTGNAYIFNEGLAVYLGTVTTPKTKWGKNALDYYGKNMNLSGLLTVSGRALIAGATDDGTTALNVNGSGKFSDDIFANGSNIYHTGGNEFNIINRNVNQSTIQTIDFDFSAITTDPARVRLFRSTNTAGARLFQIFKGDGTDTPTFQVVAETGRALIAGATDDGTTALNVNGSGKFKNSTIGEWSTSSEYARFGHNNFNTSTNYGFLQQSNGDVYISGGAIRLVNPTTIAALLTALGGVNTDNVTVKNRLYTGVLNASGNAVVSNAGITPAKILSIRCYFLQGTIWVLQRNLSDEFNQIDSSGNITCLGESINSGASYRMYVTYEA